MQYTDALYLTRQRLLALQGSVLRRGGIWRLNYVRRRFIATLNNFSFLGRLVKRVFHITFGRGLRPKLPSLGDGGLIFYPENGCHVLYNSCCLEMKNSARNLTRDFKIGPSLMVSFLVFFSFPNNSLLWSLTLHFALKCEICIEELQKICWNVVYYSVLLLLSTVLKLLQTFLHLWLHRFVSFKTFIMIQHLLSIVAEENSTTYGC